MLDHIAEIKGRNKMASSNTKISDLKNKGSVGLPEEKTLFYGIETIDSVEFKIKVKLTKTNYFLFAKNNHSKAMVEMSYNDYMKLHLGELRGNPCNIFRYLKLKGDRL